MQGLDAVYKFTYAKPKPQKHIVAELPNESFIGQHTQEQKIFFYQLEAYKYISLEVLLKSYASQLIRVSIGQWLLLIQAIYNQLLEIEKKGEAIGKITLENIWIQTDTGFCGIITVQNEFWIKFLNFQDKKVSLKENLAEFSLIVNTIWKICRDTEFRLRVRDRKNTLEVQQIINVIDQIVFYEVQQALYWKPEQLNDKIQEFVNDQQETQYEYQQQDVQYIVTNNDILLEKLNKLADPEGSNSEFEQHKKLLKWQKALFDSFQGFDWNQQSYQYVQETLQLIESKIMYNDNITPYKKKYMEKDTFYLMEQYQFFNFNSPKIRLSSVLKIRRQIRILLAKKIIDPVQEKLEDAAKKYKENLIKNASYESVKNLEDTVGQYYSSNSSQFYGLDRKFYFTINFQWDWEKSLIEYINYKQIDYETQLIKKELEARFLLLEQKYNIRSK